MPGDGGCPPGSLETLPLARVLYFSVGLGQIRRGSGQGLSTVETRKQLKLPRKENALLGIFSFFGEK